MTTSLQSRWIVLGALSFMMCVSMALPIYGGSVLGTYMTANLHWERSTLGLLIAANMAANGLCAPFVAALTTRIGVRWCLIIGCILMAAAAIALGTLVTAPWQAALAFGAIGIAATFASVIPCQTAVAAWFGYRRAFALSVLYAAMGIGGFVFVWLVTWAIQGSGVGYRMGCWVFVGFAVLGLFVALIFVRDKPREEQFEAWENADREYHSTLKFPPPKEATGEAPRFREVLWSPALWAIYYSMFATTCGSAFVIAHAQAHLRDIGHSPVTAAATISIISAAMVAGNFGIGSIAQRIGPRRAYFGALALFALGLFTLIYAKGSLGLYGYAVFYGLGFGAAQVGPMVLLSTYWGVQVFPMLTALGLLIQTAGAAVSPIAAGIYFDRAGRYQPVIIVIVMMAVVAMVLLRLIGPPKSIKAAEGPAEEYYPPSRNA
ncbi:MFS family permease [Robbsia andropogonis]|uniref:MFS transporter n=1 Tax=Robbsia andropogonis TaxID=28092 RepID=UPI0020A035D6|nr:MFS transporter [Robbsia andropogonis]MCP1120229.1 MFS transporter [Robbsia andropogonis]MCP1130125.1 MFS transporter [Robbsia andropogonis]